MEKVKVTKEVADEIEYANAEYRSIASATLYLLNEADLTDVQVDQALRGYYVGYEVEKTPEEKIRHHYEYSKTNAESTDYDVKYIGQAEVETIEFMLETLGIKIEGVNA